MFEVLDHGFRVEYMGNTSIDKYEFLRYAK